MTFKTSFDIIGIHEISQGEVSEGFKELVLKTSDTARYRGFESHLLRQFFESGGRTRKNRKQFISGEIPKRPKGLPC